jgi:MYXO-CTERM domain-containing protein
MLAQSLGEYGAQGGSAGAGVQRAIDSIRSTIGDTDPKTWLVVAGIALAALFFWSRRRSA